MNSFGFDRTRKSHLWETRSMTDSSKSSPASQGKWLAKTLARRPDMTAESWINQRSSSTTTLIARPTVSGGASPRILSGSCFDSDDDSLKSGCYVSVTTRNYENLRNLNQISVISWIDTTSGATAEDAIGSQTFVSLHRGGRSQISVRGPTAMRFARWIRDAAFARIAELEIDANDDDLHVNQGSRYQIRSFFQTFDLACRPGIFLLDSGNFRCSWQGAPDRHVGIEFLGGNEVRYVIFAPDENDHVSREAGVASLGWVVKRLQLVGLKSWVIA